MMKIFALVLCVAFVSAAPQVEENDDDFELRKWLLYSCFYHWKFSFSGCVEFMKSSKYKLRNKN